MVMQNLLSMVIPMVILMVIQDLQPMAMQKEKQN
jgi:hypothetical protein